MVLHAASLGAVLYTLWFLLSGYTDPLLLLLGFLSCVLVVTIALRMEIIDHESHPIHLTPMLPLYWLWLLWEIVKANFAVAKLILNPALPISPTVVRVRTTRMSELGRVVLANSITLTPGTVSMSLEGDQIHVHALTGAMATQVEQGEMDRRVAKLEGST